jgi:hypothetical protein
MSDTQEIEQAVKRLNDALDGLDAVMELRLEADRRRGMLADEVHDFSLDRSRLAAELDEVQAHTRALASSRPISAERGRR